MDVKSLLMKKNKDNSKNIEPKNTLIEQPEYLLKAEKCADIVNNYLKKGKYELIEEGLESCSNSQITNIQYSFEATRIISTIAMVIASVGIVLFFLLGLFGCSVIYYSGEYSLQTLLWVVSSLAVVVINMCLIIFGIDDAKFVHRYNEYCDYYSYKKEILIDDIVAFSKRKKQIIIKDLKKAIKRRIIPEGYLVFEEKVLISSKDTLRDYIQKKDVYDRMFSQQLEERHRIDDMTPEIKSVIETGNYYVKKINEKNNKISDSEITKKLNRMEAIVASIFREVEIHQDKAENLRKLLKYYLPTTDKLLSEYIRITVMESDGKICMREKVAIKQIIDKLNIAFDEILNQFFFEQEMDTLAEISALETLMKQDGLLVNSELIPSGK